MKKKLGLFCMAVFLKRILDVSSKSNFGEDITTRLFSAVFGSQYIKIPAPFNKSRDFKLLPISPHLPTWIIGLKVWIISKICCRKRKQQVFGKQSCAVHRCTFEINKGVV
jgi:hypothetical protein